MVFSISGGVVTGPWAKRDREEKVEKEENIDPNPKFIQKFTK